MAIVEYPDEATALTTTKGRFVDGVVGELTANDYRAVIASRCVPLGGGHRGAVTEQGGHRAIGALALVHADWCTRACLADGRPTLVHLLVHRQNKSPARSTRAGLSSLVVVVSPEGFEPPAFWFVAVREVSGRARPEAALTW